MEACLPKRCPFFVNQPNLFQRRVGRSVSLSLPVNRVWNAPRQIGVTPHSCRWLSLEATDGLFFDVENEYCCFVSLPEPRSQRSTFRMTPSWFREFSTTCFSSIPAGQFRKTLFPIESQLGLFVVRNFSNFICRRSSEAGKWVDRRLSSSSPHPPVRPDQTRIHRLNMRRKSTRRSRILQQSGDSFSGAGDSLCNVCLHRVISKREV